MGTDKARIKSQLWTLSKADMLAVEDAIKCIWGWPGSRLIAQRRFSRTHPLRLVQRHNRVMFGQALRVDPRHQGADRVKVRRRHLPLDRHRGFLAGEHGDPTAIVCLVHAQKH